MKKIKHIHFTSIKGVGMTPLAIIAKEAGFKVTGSDVSETYITDEVLKKAGIINITNFNKDNVKNADFVITSGANGGYENVEVVAAKEKNIPIASQGEAVGLFMSGKLTGRKDIKGISVVGCHGKTTTTAMISTIISRSSKDPSYIIGTGQIPSLSGSGHYGKGKYFVAEADEYATEPKYDKTPKFMWQHPKIAVVTNIEYDHPDLYPTFQSLTNAYRKFIEQVMSDRGLVIACGDDPNIQKILQENKKNIITYGFNSNNDYILNNIIQTRKGAEFEVFLSSKKLGKFNIQVFGHHNCLNALASIIVGFKIGLDVRELKKYLKTFKGTKRRIEYIGKTQEGAFIFDDYAHHPTEIKATIRALKKSYERFRIVVIFQPHTFSRTKLLFNEFVNSFQDINLVILTDIYASQRESFDDKISSKDLALSISKKQDAIYIPKLNDVIKYLKEKEFGSDTIIITMGAGDVYKIAYDIWKN